jgi:P-type Ca2+ transporter type 2C
VIEIAVQILIVFVGGAAFQVTRMGGREWGISIALGFASLPLGALIRLIPNGPCEIFFKKLGFLGRRKDSLPTTNPEAEGWAGAITMVRDNLSTFSNLRGGRVRSSSFVIKSRSAKLNPELGPLPL